MNIISNLFFGFQYLLIGITLLGKFSGVKSIPKCGAVFITVSAYYDKLILNWHDVCRIGETLPFRVYLTTRDITNMSKFDYLDFATCSKYSTSSYKTDISMTSWSDWRKGRSVNLGFWIASVDTHGKVMESRPFRLYPTWMHDNREKLKSQFIGRIAIPGTHNSGCYDAHGFYPYYIYTQKYSVRKQLEAGIRYLDLRIGYYDDSEKFYINHDFMWVEPIYKIYRDIMSFLSDSPNEIIVLDFHRFPKPDPWTDYMHHRFIEFTLARLGSRVFVPSKNFDFQKGPTLEEIWNSGKNIILAYNSEKRGHKELFPRVDQKWADTKDVPTLKNFLNSGVNHHIYPLQALMAVLTPTGTDVFFLTNNLLTLADYSNPEVTKWVRDLWRDKVNIIATDYFFGNNLIEVCIDININK